jgi:ATP-dependent helicase HrpA
MVQVPTIPPSERYPGRPATGRIVVIAPTRAACETIELGVSLTHVETVLQREHGEDVRRLASSGKGFGIVAGTGTGKTLAIRPIAEEIVGLPLRVGVVNREREATPDTPNWNVVIVTTGIARRWLQDELIAPEDTLVVDEIHQTSAELELCLALGKRLGCRFIWLSATVDPTFYARYLDSVEVIESSAFDPALAANVGVVATTNVSSFLDERFLRGVLRRDRGVAVFVPTRAQTEDVAQRIGERWDRIFTEFYHGGEPVSKLRPFLDGEAPRPFVLSMTAAGQSALNIRGLDTVVIEDAQFTSVVRRGRRVLTRLPLGANEILQMAGRVHGRVADGEVWILSERDIDFASLQPTEPNFQLAGDPERVAMTCADVGVRADDLDLPVPLDRIAYQRSVELLTRRGLIAAGRLTEYGRKVEVLPVDRPWGELLVNGEDHLIPLVATCASIESLHRMTRQDRYIQPYVVPGSDHLTAYRLYEDALRTCGSMGSVYGLPRHIFDAEALEEWAEERGVLVRSI